MPQTLISDAPFKYAMCFHHTDDGIFPLVDYIKTRFEEEYWWKVECSEEGNWHIQACGQTKQEFVDNERKIFQPKGRMSKYIRRTEITKPYSIKQCYKPWFDNVMYVTKPYTVGTTRITWDKFQGGTSRPDWQDMCEAAAQRTETVAVVKEKKMTLEQRLRNWYEALPEDQRPKTEMDAIDKMYTDKVIPLSAHTPAHYVRSAYYLINRYVNTEQSKYEFAEACRRLLNR